MPTLTNLLEMLGLRSLILVIDPDFDERYGRRQVDVGRLLLAQRRGLVCEIGRGEVHWLGLELLD